MEGWGGGMNSLKPKVDSLDAGMPTEGALDAPELLATEGDRSRTCEGVCGDLGRGA